MKREALIVLLLAGLASWMIFSGLGQASFHDEDEALYAAISREMIEDGDWLTPHYWQEPFLHKPPLGYWLIATSMSLLPEHPEFAARVPSAFAAVLLILLVYFEAKRLGGVFAGLAAGLLLLFNHQFLFEHAARSGSLDAPVMLFSFAALVWGLRSGPSRAACVASAVALACLAMLKAPLILFPALGISIALWRQNKDALWRYWRWTGAILVLLAVPWHLVMLVLHGSAFVRTYLLYEILGRAGATASAFSPSHWVHLDAFWRSFLPVSPFIAFALFASLSPWPSLVAGLPDRIKRSLQAHAIFVLLLLAALSLVVAKWPWYGLPAYPSLALIAGVLTAELISRRHVPQLTAALAAAGMIRILSCTPNPSYAPASRPSFLWPVRDSLYGLPDSLPAGWTLLAGLLFAAVLAAAFLTRRSSTRVQAALLLSTAVALGGVLFLDLQQVPERFRHPAASLGESLAAEDYDQVFLAGFRHQRRYRQRMAPIESFYLGELDGARIVDLDRPGTLDATQPVAGGRCALVNASRDPPTTLGDTLASCVQHFYESGEMSPVR